MDDGDIKRLAIRSLVLLPRLQARLKESAELQYWRRTARAARGQLRADEHYQQLYCDVLGLSAEFYAHKRILDIGCGPRGSLEWAHDAKERVGLDPLVDRYRELGIERHEMRYCHAYSENIPYPADYFDVTTSINSLDHVADLRATIGQITHVTRPGGWFVLLTEVNHPPTRTEPQSLSWNVLREFIGWTVEREVHREKDHAPYVTPYDHDNTLPRPGIIAALLVRAG